MKKKRPALFRLSVKEQKGLILLTVLVFLLFIVWQLIRQLPPELSDTESKAFQTAWSDFKKAQAAETANTTAPPDSISTGLQTFDPNLADKRTLLQLGLPAHTVNILLNYRKHGGRFRKKEDLKKIYTLTEADYNKVAPYIRFGGSSQEPDGPQDKKLSAVIELNNASAKTLSQLPGMNYKLAKRLLEFRDYLGGFYTVRQIQELYGFPDSLFPAIKRRLSASEAHLRKININKASSNDLEDHPYITRKMANEIFALKNNLGQIDSIEQIKQLTLINEENYRKIAPYLKTD